MRESYARYSWRIIGMEISVGLQWNKGESVRALWRLMRDTIALSLSRTRSVEADDMTLAVEEALRRDFPDRAYFIEVSDGDEQWTQVYDPRDFVKERCDCPCKSRAECASYFMAGLDEHH